MVKAFWGLKAWLRVEAGFDEPPKPRLLALNFQIKMYACKSKFLEPTLTVCDSIIVLPMYYRAKSIPLIRTDLLALTMSSHPPFGILKLFVLSTDVACKWRGAGSGVFDGSRV